MHCTNIFGVAEYSLASLLTSSLKVVLLMFWVIRQCLCIQNSPSVAMRRFYDMVSVEPTKIFMLGPSVSRVAIHVSIAASSWNIVQVSTNTYIRPHPP